MKPKVSIITLGVSDLAASRAFYEKGLGLPVSDESNENIVFFTLEGTWLALFPREELQKDIGVTAKNAAHNPHFTIAHNEPSRDAVDATIERARAAGATIIKEPQEVFWGGYSGYFADPDGFYWEIAHNPYMDLT